MLSQVKAHVYIRDEHFNLLPDQSTSKVFKKARIPQRYARFRVINNNLFSAF